MIGMLAELWVTVGGNTWVEILGLLDVRIGVLTDLLINMLVAVIVGVRIGALVDVEVVVATSALVGWELSVPLSCVVEVMSDDWDEAVTDIDISIDRRVGKLIGTLTRV